MSATKLDNIHATGAKAKYLSALPSSAADFYGVPANDVESTEWQGGEMVYHSVYNRLYIQTAADTKTPIWKRLTDAWASTTSSSSSTSTSSSTSSSTSTTSSTTSTSSSTSTTTSSSSSSTTSSSTSTSSTTTP